jgi:hypothetical protein
MKNVISRIAQLSLSNILAMALVGCFNMPTPPSQITGSYTSGLNYKDLSCQELAAEQASFARRENQLTTAQDQRIKTSSVQALLMGFGQGDGIEASELATVRGEKEALRTELNSKGCRYETLKSRYRN